MATTAFLAAGTQLDLGNSASPPVFTTIYEVVSIGDFGAQNDLVEVTHMQSSAKEYIYGLSDGVEFPVVVNYNPTNQTHIDLRAAQASRLTKSFRLTIPTVPTKTFSFDALVLGQALPLAPNSAGQMTFTLKISGAISGPV